MREENVVAAIGERSGGLGFGICVQFIGGEGRLVFLKTIKLNVCWCVRCLLTKALKLPLN